MRNTKKLWLWLMQSSADHAYADCGVNYSFLSVQVLWLTCRLWSSHSVGSARTSAHSLWDQRSWSQKYAGELLLVKSRISNFKLTLRSRNCTIQISWNNNNKKKNKKCLAVEYLRRGWAAAQPWCILSQGDFCGITRLLLSNRIWQGSKGVTISNRNQRQRSVAT